MRNFKNLGLVALTGLLALASTGCDKLKARDHLNQGIAAFKSAKYAEAVEHFKQSTALDPSLPTGRQYMAIAYMVQWIPGAESPENLQFAEMARSEFNQILEKDPNDRTSLQYLAYMAYNQAQSLPQDQKLAKYDEAAKLYERMIAPDPKSKDNKEAYYTLGVIAYNRWNPARMLARSNLRMRAEDQGPLKDKKVKAELKAQYSQVIEDGIQNLDKALDADEKYDDALAFKNLLIRTRADLRDTSAEYDQDVKEADRLLQKALDTKKEKAAAAEKKTGGIVQETN